MAHAAHRAGSELRRSDAELTPALIEEFRTRLMTMKAELVHRIHAEPPGAARAAREGDLADQAAADLDFEQEALERRREHRELAAVEHALARIDNGTYGLCAVTGEPIGVRRLQANPTAMLSRAAQERREHVAGY